MKSNNKYARIQTTAGTGKKLKLINSDVQPGAYHARLWDNIDVVSFLFKTIRYKQLGNVILCVEVVVILWQSGNEQLLLTKFRKLEHFRKSNNEQQ